MPSELSFIDRIRRRATLPRSSRLILGIGDDCAIFRPPASPIDLLFTTDLLIEGTHFLRSTHTPEDAGWKALARGLSDIAAMGGDPRFCLLSLAIAPWQTDRWVDAFYRGLLRLARRESAALAGGDLSRAPQAACDIVVCGDVPRGAALRRDTARPGDLLYVSGALGGSALGLVKGKRDPHAWKRHTRPEPRLSLGRFLRHSLHASAAMDLSDGLSLDLRRLCLASGLAADITAPPRFPGATLELSLHGGEDYELLFAVPPQTNVPAGHQSLLLTPIGVLRKGRPGHIRLDGKPLAALGYDHLRGGFR